MFLLLRVIGLSVAAVLYGLLYLAIALFALGLFSPPGWLLIPFV